MKENEKDTPTSDVWEALAGMARRHRAGQGDGDTVAPFGFATRVAALGMEARQRAAETAMAALERYWLRGVALAGGLAVLALLAGIGQIQDINEMTSSPELQLLNLESLL